MCTVMEMLHKGGINGLTKLRNLFVAANIKDTKRQRALMLHYAGDDVYDIFQSLTDTGDDFDTASQKLKAYFEPKKNVAFAVYNFRQAKQNREEGIDAYVTRLRNLAKACEFADPSFEIKHQIIQNCLSQSLRRKALKDDSLTLEQIMLEARSLELSEAQAKQIEGESVAPVYKVQKHRSYQRKPQQKERSSGQSSNKCFNCGGNYPHNDTPCPAKGKTCSYCKKLNHFAKYCKGKKKQKRVNQLSNKLVTCQLAHKRPLTTNIHSMSEVNHTKCTKDPCPYKQNLAYGFSG